LNSQLVECLGRKPIETRFRALPVILDLGGGDRK
jgi:hypothetical protein